MRISHSFGKRFEDSSLLEPKRKYFIACEGRHSEYRYFKGLSRTTDKHGISPAIDFVFVEHSEGSGNHPLQLIEQASEEVQDKGNFLKGDCLCILVDRDRASFTDQQFIEAVQHCASENIKLFVSNPCFELWLLLHFSDLSEYDLEKIKANKKSGGRTYVELILKDDHLNGSYQKKTLNYNLFDDKVERAIANSSLHETDILKLKDAVGTNVGLLWKR